MNIQDTITALIDREGKYSNHPSDRGGETMWGITVAVARAHGYNGAMAQMSREYAANIYKKQYWQHPRFDEVCEVNTFIAEELLDTGVNMGTTIASQFLQRALNVLNRRGHSYSELLVDGNIGAMTLQALKSFLKHRGADGEKVLLKMLNAMQSVRYIELAESNPSQEDFIFGWQLNRGGSL